MNPQNDYNNNIVSTETKEEDLQQQASASEILPLELEEGGKSTDEGITSTETAKPVAAGGSVCSRHKGKFICLGVTLLLLVGTAIAIPLLYPKQPTSTLLEQSNLDISGLGTGKVGIELHMKINNPNRYAIAFENMQMEVYDFNGAHIGAVERRERFKVPGKSSAVMTATAQMQPSFFEVLAMGLDCIQNENVTKMKSKGTVDVRFAGKTIKQKVEFAQPVQCVATNVNGAAAPPPGVAPAGVGNGQVIQSIGNAINNGINQILGGGGAGAAPKAAPAPGQ